METEFNWHQKLKAGIYCDCYLENLDFNLYLVLSLPRIVRIAALNAIAGFIHLVCTIIGDNKYKFSSRYSNNELGVKLLELMWISAILAEVKPPSWIYFNWKRFVSILLILFFIIF